MATYGYEVLDKDGKIKKGSIDADSMEKARAELKTQGMTVVSLSEQSLLTRDIEIDIGGKPTNRDLSVFCRQFVSMTKAGVTIVEAMRMLSEQTENKKLKKALDDVRVNMEKGESLAGSLSKHPKIFPSIMVNMVAAGEASGSLEKSLERVAVQMERNSKTQALVKKAMMYPIVLLIIALAVIILMLTFVIPQYSDMFKDLGTGLPGITLAVMAASDFVKEWWYAIIAVVVVVVLGLKYFGTTNMGQHVYGKLALSIPAVKNLVVKSAASSMARTMSTLMGAGVPMVEAVEIVSRTMTNIWFKEALLEARDQIMLGVPLSRPLETSGLFPPMVYHMVKIGEESGAIEDMLDKLADYYEEEVEMAVQSLMAAMEPMIIVVLAGIVGVLIAAVMAPMMSMYGALDSV
ncbi:MAG: type II secretion system F family protein [Lachnospiraceae bacterium]|nr:type II secretion system F family protein [Lachnospiraceae bacterium]